MTADAINISMAIGEDKASGIMVENQVCISCRVAGKTRRTLINITRYILMFLIGFRIGVAVGTRKYSIIARVGMTISALVPFPLVFPGINREVLVVMIKCRGNPCIFIMAAGTLIWELQLDVIWVICCVIITLVTSNTCCRSISIVTKVAIGALAGNSSVSSIERVEVIVDGKGCRSPSRSS
jgi:hypothetical protein